MLSTHRPLRPAALAAALAAATLVAGCRADPDRAGRGQDPTITQTQLPVSDADAPPIDRAELKRRITEDVYWLSDAERDGRGLGTDGIDESAEYMAADLAAAGLEPAGTDGYFQPWTLTLGRSLDESATSLTLGGVPLELGEDYVPLSFSAPETFQGELAFAGYAVNDKASGYNDFEGVDLTGKVALVLRWEPHTPDGGSRISGGKRWSNNAPLFLKASRAAAAGASAVLIVNPPEHHEDRADLMPFAEVSARQRVPIPAFHVTPDIADALLAAAGMPPLLELQRSIDTTGEPVAVEPRAAAVVAGGWDGSDREVEAKNVIGLLPGSGELADEYVVVGGHYDHLGMGGLGSLARGVTAVHHGADDNASGTAAVIALAEMLAGDEAEDQRGGQRGGQRGVLFMGFSAEEIGLLGSDHWVKNPTVPIESVAAMVNYDMLGRPEDGVLQVGGEQTSEAFGPIVRAAAEEAGLKLNQLGAAMDGRSDHASFHRAGVPALFFFGSIHDDYHTPRDTADKVDYDFLADATMAGYEIVRELRAGPRPEFVRPARADRGRQPARRVRLGVTPDMQAYGGDEPNGVPVTDVAPGSAAASAGVEPGDVLVKLGEVETADIYGLQDALSVVEPGSTHDLLVRRDGKDVSLEVTFPQSGQ